VFNPQSLPKLSVVIPVKDGREVIASAVRTAIQAGADQVVVVDDGSNDDSGLIAERCGAEVIKQANSGAAAARRAGVGCATGTYVILLDADDVLVKEGVQASLRKLEESAPGVVAMGGGVLFRHAGGSTKRVRPWRGDLSFIRLVEAGYSPAPPSAFLWRRSVLEEVMNGVMPALSPKYADDYEVLLRGALKGRIQQHSEICTIYATVGGKSAGNPKGSVDCAQRLREYYSSMLGLKLRAIPRRRSAALIRLRSAQQFDRRVTPVAWTRNVVLACCLDPVFVITLLWNAAHLRWWPLPLEGE
jgi:glycosyltransferase involved in cell wall biosynthesis